MRMRAVKVKQDFSLAKSFKIRQQYEHSGPSILAEAKEQIQRASQDPFSVRDVFPSEKQLDARCPCNYEHLSKEPRLEMQTVLKCPQLDKCFKPRDSYWLPFSSILGIFVQHLLLILTKKGLLISTWGTRVLEGQLMSLPWGWSKTVWNAPGTCVCARAHTHTISCLNSCLVLCVDVIPSSDDH